MFDLSPHARATHRAAPYVGRAWAPTFNCWHLTQAVEREVFARALPDLAVASDDDQAAALRAITAVWRPVAGAITQALDGDILTMVGADGTHVGVMIDGKVLHNVGGVRDGVVWGSVRLDALPMLGVLRYGHLQLWRPAP
jgi:cell wall-associated NlpC family hydrolase